MGASYFLVIVVLIQFVDALEITRMKSTNNSSITLLCTATSSATNTIEWRFGNNTIDGGDAKYNVSVEDESTAFSVKLMSFLTINHPDINDEGNYTCNRGSDSSTELMLTGMHACRMILVQHLCFIVTICYYLLHCYILCAQ